MRNRSHNVMVRMDDEEYNQFCTNVKKSGQTKQAYVTNAVLHVPVMPKEELEEVQKISQLMADDNRQFRGMAVNLNQMTKRLHTFGEIPQIKELHELEQMLQKMREESERPWQLIRLLLSRQKATAD